MSDVVHTIFSEAHSLGDWLVETRRALHRIPEPGNEERETSAAICAGLDELRIPYTQIGTAVVGLLEGVGPGRCVALRADMDALPIEEPADRPYASLHRGYMHACGHDAHMTVALGVARLLSAHRQHFDGAVKFLFSPPKRQRAVLGP